MASFRYVPLRNFSAYTMLDGAMEPVEIGSVAQERGFPAIALTDRNGLFAAMAFDEGCRKVGVQPIIGAMVGVARPGSDAAGQVQFDWLALYAQDAIGYANLCRIVSASHLDHREQDPANVTLDFLAQNHHGIIALTGGGEGAVTRLIAEGQMDAAESYLSTLETIFPDRLYLELCRRDNAVEDAAEDMLISLAYERNLPLIATNPACYANPGFHQAHDALTCIAASTYVENSDRDQMSPHLWIKSAPMMEELFSDLPEALINTVVVAQRCAASPPKRSPILPSLAGDIAAEAQQLRDDATAGLHQRLAHLAALGESLDEGARAAYFARLDFELDVIVSMGFPGYFLIVADFIKWAKEQDIPVGPGRGSGAGSVVAWALTITDLDPIKLGLLFERFLNPERVSMPDFDIDFCETRRGEVIRYVQEKYGNGQVAQIITFGKLKARAVLRDVGRVLQMPYGQVDRLTKLVPNHPTDPYTLQQTLFGGSDKGGNRRSPIEELSTAYRSEPDVKKLFDLSMQLEGLPRHSSTHAAGVVIGDRHLAELVPLYRDPRSDLPVTQFDMKYVEKAGLVKFDFLGLKTLSVLKKAVEMLSKRGVSVDLAALPWDDEAVYALLQRGETVGVFQLESEGMRRTLSAVKPSNFGDIIALVSLYRPGPMDNIPSFGDRKNGREDIRYPHPMLEEVLKETYGIFVYQEQVMQAAQVIAGYSLGDADLLRRAMGKKIQSEMDAQRNRFVEGAQVNGLTPEHANELFDLIDKFAGYGFNKSHAAAYALLAYHTAWLKTHYPHEFYAASMCFDMHQTDKLAVFVDDMRRLNIRVLPPSINHSEAEFSVETDADGLAVRYALAGLKNVGEKAMTALVVERENNGPFASLQDFASRVEPQLLNKRQIENLASAGAFDVLDPRRAAIFAGADVLLSVAQSEAQQRASGQGGLFGEADPVAGQAIRLPDAGNWSLGEIMGRERDAFGYYFSSHPVTQYRATTLSHGAMTYAAIATSEPIPPGVRKPAVMAALVEGVRWRDSRRGNRFLLVDLSDSSGQFGATCFEEEACKQLAELATKSACALLNVELDVRDGDDAPRVSVKRVRPLDGLERITRTKLELYVHHEQALTELANMVAPMVGGRSELFIQTPGVDGRSIRLCLGRNYHLDADLVDRLNRVDGIDNPRLGPLNDRNAPNLRLVS